MFCKDLPEKSPDLTAVLLDLTKSREGGMLKKPVPGKAMTGGRTMPIRLPSIRRENRTIRISELNLHWIGILLLCLSTLSTAVIQRGMLGIDGSVSQAEMEQILASGAAQWAVQAVMLSMAATLALPLYARLLMEAVGQAEDRRRLMLELGGCALVSEVPYDWAMSGKMVDGSVQNPAWGLLLGGIMLLFFQRQKPASRGADLTAKAMAVFAAAAWALLLRVRMGVPLVLLCALFYFAYREKKAWIALLGGVVLTVFYFPAPLGLLLAHWYDNKSRARCWVFCVLYTIQLVIFGAMGVFMASR